ncbi:hypothetical protein EZS27_041304, partial [termite gut metagenome]
MKYRKSKYVLFLFAVFLLVWYGKYNRFFVLDYHEQIQLFRFDYFYLLSYLKCAGGLSRYLGSFLTQFYYYPLAGAFVITLVVVAIYLLFDAICKKKGGI